MSEHLSGVRLAGGMNSKQCLTLEGLTELLKLGMAIGSGQPDPTRLLLDMYNNRIGSTRHDYYTGQIFRPRSNTDLVRSTRPI